MEKYIKIRAAAQNNLKHIDVDIPLEKITCIGGVSGSGKSSLAFGTIASESKRRFLNSFPSALKFFGERPVPPKVDSIAPILPCFSLPQHNPVMGSRSSVLDNLGLTDKFQKLFFYFGEPYCPDHEIPTVSKGVEEELEAMGLTDTDKVHLFINKKIFLSKYPSGPFPTRSLSAQDEIRDFDPDDELWEIIRFKFSSVTRSLKKINEFISFPIEAVINSGEKKRISSAISCSECDYIPAVTGDIRQFSPYNAIGACAECSGHGANLIYDEDKLLDKSLSINENGIRFLEYKRFKLVKEKFLTEARKLKFSLTKPLSELDDDFYNFLWDGGGKYVGFNSLIKYLESKRYKAPVRIFIRHNQKEVICHSCNGARVSRDIAAFRVNKLAYQNVLCSELSASIELLSKIKSKNDVCKNIIAEILNTLAQASEMGLGHLKLSRKTKTLTSSEYQRLLLVKFLAYKGKGALFVLDEPSVGLCAAEKESLMTGLLKLKKQGNTVLLVEHCSYLKTKSDFYIELGPGSGASGGEITFEGKFKNNHIKKRATLSSKANKKSFITVKAPQLYGRTYSDFKIQKNAFNLVRGDSGSGKTASVIHTLSNEISYNLFGEKITNDRGSFKQLKGSEGLDNVLVFSPSISTKVTSRSTVGSLTGLGTEVRKYLASSQLSRSLGLKDGHFSFNSQLGKCSKCEGRGVITIDMQFLEDVILECDECRGYRIKNQYATLKIGSHFVHEYSSMPISNLGKTEVKFTPKHKKNIILIDQLLLSHLNLGRPLNSLSGGERLRVQFFSQLSKKKFTNALLIFENISYGLSDRELAGFVTIFDDLLALGNTIVLIDQNSYFDELAQNLIVFT